MPGEAGIHHSAWRHGLTHRRPLPCCEVIAGLRPQDSCTSFTGTAWGRSTEDVSLVPRQPDPKRLWGQDGPGACPSEAPRIHQWAASYCGYILPPHSSHPSLESVPGTRCEQILTVVVKFLCFLIRWPRTPSRVWTSVNFTHTVKILLNHACQCSRTKQVSAKPGGVPRFNSVQTQFSSVQLLSRVQLFATP